MARYRSTVMALLRGQSSLVHYKGYIGGRWVDGDSTFPVYNPATGQEIGQVANMGEKEGEIAVQEAYKAFQSWKKTTAKERSDKLKRYSQLILERQEDLAKLMTTEQGKPLADALSEARYTASVVEWFAEEARRVYGDIVPNPVPGRRLLVLKQPIGVSALWMPWNFPMGMISRAAAAALAAGCTVIVKPSEETPFCALALQQLTEEAGFPPGVYNTVTCSRERVNALTDVVLGSELVTKLTFTGSTATGKILMSKCIDTVKKVSLELGGNGAFIVFESAKLEDAVRGVLASKFRNTGQACISTNRILVQDKIYEEFARMLAETMDRELRTGDGSEAAVNQGPLINDKAISKMERHVSDAVSKGAKALRGGRRHPLGANFYESTLLTDVTKDMAVANEETFGPIAPLIRFKTEEEAVMIANSTHYGLSSYFYSQDVSQIWRVADALESGVMGVNEGSIASEVVPFGGWKQSGLGREGSKYGIEEYLETKYVCMGGITETSST